jgi:hypothetical protein
LLLKTRYRHLAIHWVSMSGNSNMYLSGNYIHAIYLGQRQISDTKPIHVYDLDQFLVGSSKVSASILNSAFIFHTSPPPPPPLQHPLLLLYCHCIFQKRNSQYKLMTAGKIMQKIRNKCQWNMFLSFRSTG